MTEENDQLHRRRARNVGESFLVQAPAGSGKTTLLVQRYLALLATVDEPEQVRALTFARKSAVDMRTKVVEALAQAAHDVPPTDPHQRVTWDLARAALQRSEARGWRLLTAPTRLRLSTIDAYCAELAARMPWLSRCGPSPRPTDQPEALYKAAADATLGLLEQAPEHPLADDLRRLADAYAGDCGKLARGLAALLGKRDQWLPLLLRHRNDEIGAHATDAAAALARQMVETARARLQACGCDADVAALGALCARHVAPEHPIARLAGLTALPAAADVPAWLGIRHLLLTGAGKIRQSKQKKDGFVDRDSKALFATIAPRLSPAAVAALYALDALPVSLDAAERELLAATHRVLLRLAAELRLQFQRRRQVDFTEVALEARRALGASATPSAVAFALDGGLRHLLVDEFQDISHAQFELLQALVCDWLPDGERTVFLVGDPMQAIYGFRNSDVALFHRVRERGLAQLRPHFLRLQTNFRSRAELIEWFNGIFQPSFDDCPGAGAYAPMAPPLTATAAAPAAAAAVGAPSAPLPAPAPAHVAHSYSLWRGGGASAETARLLNQVQRMADALGPGEQVAVLARNRTHVAPLLAAFERRGIDYHAPGLRTLDASPVVQDLLALTGALLQPAHRVAWLALLRAPWCGLTLADLHALCAGDTATPLWLLLGEPDRRARLSPHGQARVAWLVERLAPAVSARGRIPARALVEACWHKLGGPACLAEPGQAAHAAEFFAVLESADGDGGVDLDLLADRLQAPFHRPPIEATARIQVLTIHQAKGLEFARVVLPALARRNRNDAGARLLYWASIDIEGRPWDLLAPAASKPAPNSLTAWLREHEKQRRYQEELRVLYVAATRAKSEIALHGRIPAGHQNPTRGTALHAIWSALPKGLFRDAPAATPTAPGAGDAAAPPQLRRVAADWVPRDPPRALAVPAVAPEPAGAAAHRARHWAAPMARQVGTAVHRLLRRMGERGRLDWSPAELDNALRAAGVAPQLLPSARQRASAALAGLRSSDRAAWILQPHTDARCEYALTGLVEGRLREVVVDRTFVDEAGVRWIIDYKVAAHEGGDRDRFLDEQRDLYRDQLDTYAALLAGQTGAVRCALYFPLFDAWREWTP